MPELQDILQDVLDNISETAKNPNKMFTGRILDTL